jgi:hypothetical protein
MTCESSRSLWGKMISQLSENKNGCAVQVVMGPEDVGGDRGSKVVAKLLAVRAVIKVEC